MFRYTPAAGLLLAVLVTCAAPRSASAAVAPSRQARAPREGLALAFQTRRELLLVVGPWSSASRPSLGIQFHDAALADSHPLATSTSRTTHIARAADVVSPEVYPGIDLAIRAPAPFAEALEFDLVVAPGGDPDRIRFAYTGVDRIELRADGSLLLATGVGVIRQSPPTAYQQRGRCLHLVPSRIVRHGANRFGFAVEVHDPSLPLIIDPVLTYATYFGGTGSETALAAAVDANGRAVIVGQTNSADLPVLNAVQASYGGGPSDAFVAVVDPHGKLGFATYLGGNSTVGDIARGVAMDMAGNAIVVGVTASTDFPVKDAFQATLRGSADAFVTKLDPAGQLIFSTYFGGSLGDGAAAVAVDGAGSIYITGSTSSVADFPLLGAFQTTHGSVTTSADAFVAKFSSAGALLYSSFLGGDEADWGKALAVRGDGSVLVVGETTSTRFPIVRPVQAALASFGKSDAFVTEVAPSGSAVTFSSYLGGSEIEFVAGVAVDPAGHIYLTGETISDDFPLRSPLQASRAGAGDAFMTRIDPSSPLLVFSTYLGGTDTDLAGALRVDASGAFIAGRTYSSDWPLAAPLQPIYGGAGDAFYSQLSSDGATLLSSGYYGGSGGESSVLALDACGSLILSGGTGSADLLTKDALQPILAGGSDAFVSRRNADSMPGSVGNTLRLGKDPSPGSLRFRWTDLPLALRYDLREASRKGSRFDTITLTATSGTPGAVIPLPAADQVLYSVVGVAACGIEGPY